MMSLAGDPLPSVPSFDVLGLRVHAVTRDAVIQIVRNLISSKGTIVFCTVSSILSARRESAVKHAIENATLVAPDGMPLVWLGRRAGFRVDRVYGPDFMLDLMSATGGEMTHFFYGGEPGVAGEMQRRLKERFPDLRIVGVRSPALHLDPARPPQADLEAINEAKPDVVWIGLGHPKQELFMHLNRDALSAPVLAGVGAAFDFHSGRKKEAPGWLKTSGLQWLHRFLHEPRRLWRRYLIGNPQFVVLLLWQATKNAIKR